MNTAGTTQMVSEGLLPRQMQALLESTRLINSTLDLDELLQIIVKVINRNLSADRTTLFLVDKEKGEIWSKVLLGDESLFIRQAIGKGISGHVAKTGEIINIPDAYKDPRFNPEVDKKSGFRTRSILCAPVLNKNAEIIGVIQTLNKENGEFNSNDVRFLQALAAHVAIAI
ncbi:MAG: GAF domain-containing protein, partial [Aliifodinibius sp.]|nr:GAF domain-containing protein [Fodinibius sp.]